MPAALTKTCDSCGESHVLFLGTADMAGGLDRRGDLKRYEYTCPKTRATVPFQDKLGGDWWEANVKVRPRGAVELREVS
jgi:hypothetical protein